MNINIPINRTRLSEKNAIKSVSKVLQDKKFIVTANNSDYDFSVENDYYYPYWIGEVYTRKQRFLVKPKEITFFVICDALHEQYIVLRGLPKIREINCDKKCILPAVLNRKSFDRVVSEAQRDRIDRQFIFGKPYKEIRNIFQLHIPVFKVEAQGKRGQGKKVFYVNRYTGEVRVSPT